MNRALLATLVLVSLSSFSETKPRPRVEGIVYEVFHGDSIHRMGWRVREIHVPSRNLAFYVELGELRVFRPETHRYRLPGEKVAIGGKSLPVLSIPGLETRRIGTIRLLVEHVDRLEALLKEKTRVRAIADAYLLDPAGYVPVVAFRSSNESAAAFLAKLLDEGGFAWMGVGNAGADSWSVPAARVEEARTMLRAVLNEGLRKMAADPEGPVERWLHLEFSILDESGRPEWYTERTRVPPTPPKADVLRHLQRFPGNEIVKLPEGRWRRATHGDLALERAARRLHGLPRPWTVSKLIETYRASAPDEGARRAALIYLLAASRSEKALPLVGAALGDESLDVRVAATEGILAYWDPEPTPEGGTEQAMERAAAWWKARGSDAKER